MICPKCGSSNVVKNVFIRNGKQKHQCNDCYCQFVENPQSNKISPKLINLIDNLFLENASVFLTKRDTLCLKVQLNLSMQLVLPVFLPTA
ncbi:hypothetical protein TI05_09020 [Achromatium sp. WMS3]|nr:hypothetical protein TI05_09020 [Achromatium sp. WMS3]